MTTDHELAQSIDLVLNGGGVCLIGAGFSTAAQDQSDSNVPSTTDLIKELKRLTGIPAEEDAGLADIAGYCERTPDLNRSLRKLLIARLTLTKPAEIQKKILGLSWRSIFTTNFDDVIERSLERSKLQVVTPVSDSSTISGEKLALYYLHGRALDLVETDKSPNIVISERNYLDLPSKNGGLYSKLKNELFCAKRIFIIGYSLRDLEIARLVLSSGNAFREKTTIITREGESALNLSRLSEFGTVYPCGLDGLVRAILLASEHFKKSTQAFAFIDDVKAARSAEDVQVDDFIHLILTGYFNHEKFQNQIQISEPSDIYAITRDALSTIIDRSIESTNRFIISSDFGNGKTVFLSQLQSRLLVKGFRVIRVSSELPEAFQELERALSIPDFVAFIIDDVVRYRRAAEFIGARITNNNILVCATRADPDDVAFKELEKNLGGSARQIDLNRLSQSELAQWDSALERWGLWEQQIASNAVSRISFLQTDCGAENRSIVLALFRTSRISAKIDEIVSFFLRQKGHEKAFVALLISSLCQKHVSWESIVSWLELDEQTLRRDIVASEIADLFVNGRTWNIFTSAQLAEYILRQRFVQNDKDLVVEVFSTIVSKTAESANDNVLGWEFRENLKELMKFRFLTRLFGDEPGGITLVNTVYRKLSGVPRIRSNPQFWLQYAMSRMEVDDLTTAETYLNTALGLAVNKGKQYSPFQILDQRARMYLRKNATRSSSFNVTEIQTAINDLSALARERSGSVTYLYRSVPLICDFLESHIDECDSDLRDKFINFLDLVKSEGDQYNQLPRAQKGETPVLRKAMQDALRILRFA